TKDKTLTSPWEESIPLRLAENNSRIQSKTVIRCDSETGSSCSLSRGSTRRGRSSSTRSIWRHRSVSSSMKYVSSKRHGRTLKMEQKATKVLGIIFLTFVLSWS
ncbi:unnamed protein product, partial [Meganyctiphanes norvegica]